LEVSTNKLLSKEYLSWQVNHGLPEIKKHLVSGRGNIAAAKFVGEREGIYVSLNYVVSAFACLREREKSPV
jgi:hypothetical protein